MLMHLFRCTRIFYQLNYKSPYTSQIFNSCAIRILCCTRRSPLQFIQWIPLKIVYISVAGGCCSFHQGYLDFLQQCRLFRNRTRHLKNNALTSYIIYSSLSPVILFYLASSYSNNIREFNSPNINEKWICVVTIL